MSFFFFLPHRASCGILVPRPGIEPIPPALEAWHHKHWTAREVPKCLFYSHINNELSRGLPQNWEDFAVLLFPTLRRQVSIWSLFFFSKVPYLLLHTHAQPGSLQDFLCLINDPHCTLCRSQFGDFCLYLSCLASGGLFW